MSGSMYPINKGINKSIEFKGIKAQYIGYLGVGLLVLMILFAVLYIAGMNTYLLLLLVLGLGTLLFLYVSRMSALYGAHGMLKKVARRSLPKTIRVKSRKLFLTRK